MNGSDAFTILRTGLLKFRSFKNNVSYSVFRPVGQNIYFGQLFPNPDCTSYGQFAWDLLLSQFLTISKGIYNSQKTFCVYGSSNWIKMFGLVQALQNLNSKYAQSTPHDTAPPWNFEWDKRNASLFNISDKLCDNCHRSHYKFSSISQMFFLRSTPCENNKTK